MVISANSINNKKAITLALVVITSATMIYMAITSAITINNTKGNNISLGGNNICHNHIIGNNISQTIGNNISLGGNNICHNHIDGNNISQI